MIGPRPGTSGSQVPHRFRVVSRRHLPKAGFVYSQQRRCFHGHNLILAAGLFACLIPAGTFAQESRKTVTVEVYLPEGARLFIEGQETRSKGPMRRFVSPPLPPGKYTYTIKAIIPGPERAANRHTPDRRSAGRLRIDRPARAGQTAHNRRRI